MSLADKSAANYQNPTYVGLKKNLIKLLNPTKVGFW